MIIYIHYILRELYLRVLVGHLYIVRKEMSFTKLQL
jgi:hypothetical protein